MKMTKILLGSAALILLSACGGGGSSSGGSGGDNPLAGTYSGNHTVTFSGAGPASTDVIFLSMTVNGDGTFRIVDGADDAESIPAVGTLNGDKFNATGTGSGTVDNVTCDLSITYSGSIANSAASGTDTGSGTCRFQNREVVINISGQFDLPRTSSAKATRTGSIMSKAAILLQ